MAKSLSALKLSAAPVLIVAALLFAAPAAAQQADDFHPFLGSYAGEVEVVGDGPETRLLKVDIEQTGEQGFNVTWSTTTRKPSGEAKTDTYHARFAKAASNIYHVAEKDFSFGGANGTTYAMIVDNTMTVIALLTTPDGHYEVQTYERTLVPGGLKLNYKRRRDRVDLKSIEAMLKRVK